MNKGVVLACVSLGMVVWNVPGFAAEGDAPQARLVEGKAIFALSADTTVRENRGIGSMKLSPDGKRLLYIRRRTLKPDPGGRTRRAYDLILRDVAGGKEKALKIPAYDWDDIAVMMLSMNVFDAAGKRVALGIGVDANADGVHEHRQGKEKLQAGLYDLAADKITKVGEPAEIALLTFDGSRKNLILIVADVGAKSGKMYTTPAGKIKLRELSVWGLPRSPCPAADLLPLLLPPDRDARRAAQRPKADFVLLDLAKDKVVAKLPIRGRNTKLDDYNPQWTANGGYLYYIDVDTEPGPDGRPRPKYETRIWDRKKGQLVGDVPRAVAIGPGPTQTGMVLIPYGKEGALIVHDAAGGKQWNIAAESVRPISIQGEHILYVKRSADGKEILCRGRIELPK